MFIKVKEERKINDFPPINYKVWRLLYVSHVNLGKRGEDMYFNLKLNKSK